MQKHSVGQPEICGYETKSDEPKQQTQEFSIL